jgi:hypothetical protein
MISLLVPLACTWSTFPTANPARRSPDTWTEEDLHALFYDDTLHWAKRAHGCSHTWRSWLRCKGRVAGVLRALELRRNPTTERFVIALVRHRDPDVSSRAAETLGYWRCEAARPALRLRLRELLGGQVAASDDELMVVDCVAWALEQLKATESLDELRLDVAHAHGIRAHALAVLESRTNCPGCASPHRK